MTARLIARERYQRECGPTDEWITERWLLDALGGADSFDLDPASPVVRPWPTARRHYTRVDNGLTLPWEGRVWLNPPYSRPAIERFMGRMSAHGRGLALIFAKTDTDLFHRFVWPRADAVFFFRGRLNFCTPDGKPMLRKTGRPANGGAPNVLCIYGQDDAEIVADAGLDGELVALRLPRSYLIAALAPSWREAIAAWVTAESGPVRLSELYRAFASHPKTRRNPNWRAKVRQTLQLGPFERVDRGVWRAA